MTLSLDDVRNKRFRMARKSGYEVLEVDEFVDEIEESFAQLIEENQNLKKQVDSLRGSADSGADRVAEPATVKPATPPAPAPQSAAAANLGPETIVVTTAKEASTAVVRLVEMSTEQAERLVAEATEDAKRIREEAHSDAHHLTSEAQQHAERVESEARVNAARLDAQTLSRTEQLDREIDEHRAEMLTGLQTQRDQLSSTVRDLRAFEAAYRSNLTEHLRTQISTLESGRAEPTPVPEAVLGTAPTPVSSNGDSASGPDSSERDADVTDGGDTGRSETPRLDALLGDQH